MTCFSLILANLPISSLLSCPYSTEGMKHIISAGWTVRWKMTQCIGWWSWYHYENRKMSVNVMLNWPHLVCIWIIVFFDPWHHAYFHGMYLELMVHHCRLYMRYSPKCWKMSVIPVWKYEDEHEAEAVWISVVYFLAFEPCIMLKFHTVHQSWYCSCLGHFCLDSEGIPSYGIPKICLGLLNFEVFKKQQNIDLIFCQVMFFLLFRVWVLYHRFYIYRYQATIIFS